MLGAILGDIIGSKIELDNNSYIGTGNLYTDNTILIYAVLKTTDFLIDHNSIITEILNKEANKSEVDNYKITDFKKVATKTYAKKIREICNDYPNVIYGKKFNEWIKDKDYGSYNSKASGCLIRVSGIPFITFNLEQALIFSNNSISVTHSHEEATIITESYIKLLYLVKEWNSDIDSLKETIKTYSKDLGIEIKSVEEYKNIEGSYLLATETLSRALACILEANSFKEAINNVFLINSNKNAACVIVGTFSEYMYGIPEEYLSMITNYFNHKSIEIIKFLSSFYIKEIKLEKFLMKNIYGENNEKLKLYIDMNKILLEDGTASYDPLKELNENEYYSDMDIKLAKKNKKGLINYFKNIYDIFSNN